MGIFNSIKKSRRASSDIDEKIEYLDKELEKNGLREGMTTSNVYVGGQQVDNPIYSSFKSSVFNARPLGHSPSDNSGGLGGAYTGKVIAGEHGLSVGVHDSILNLKGVANSPPHPVSGRRRYASTRTGMVSYSPTQPGVKQGNSEYPTGSVAWLWNPTQNNSDGTTGNWYPLEFDVGSGQWGFWDTNFLGFGFLNTNLSQLEFSSGDSTGASVVSLFDTIGITNRENIGTEKTIVLQKNDLGSAGFLPININLSTQGYNYLKNRARGSGFINYKRGAKAIAYNKPPTKSRAETRSDEVKQLRSKGDNVGANIFYTKDRIKELEGKESLTYREESELKGLEEYNEWISTFDTPENYVPIADQQKAFDKQAAEEKKSFDTEFSNNSNEIASNIATYIENTPDLSAEEKKALTSISNDIRSGKTLDETLKNNIEPPSDSNASTPPQPKPTPKPTSKTHNPPKEHTFPDGSTGTVRTPLNSGGETIYQNADGDFLEANGKTTDQNKFINNLGKGLNSFTIGGAVVTGSVATHKPTNAEIEQFITSLDGNMLEKGKITVTGTELPYQDGNFKVTYDQNGKRVFESNRDANGNQGANFSDNSIDSPTNASMSLYGKPNLQVVFPPDGSEPYVVLEKYAYENRDAKDPNSPSYDPTEVPGGLEWHSNAAHLLGKVFEPINEFLFRGAFGVENKVPDHVKEMGIHGMAHTKEKIPFSDSRLSEEFKNQFEGNEDYEAWNDANNDKDAAEKYPPPGQSGEYTTPDGGKVKYYNKGIKTSADGSKYMEVLTMPWIEPKEGVHDGYYGSLYHPGSYTMKVPLGGAQLRFKGMGKEVFTPKPEPKPEPDNRKDYEKNRDRQRRLRRSSYEPKGNVLSEAVRLGHFEPEVLNVDINDIRKGIMPEFPKDPPPEMVDGYSEKSKLAPKKDEGDPDPFIKITKKDLAKNHMLKDSEIKKFMEDIDLINKFIKENPSELIYAQQRYPKDDPRLAQLNWQMDQMLDASKEYMDKHYPENEKLFKKIQKSIKKNIELTDPKSFKGVEIPKFKGVDLIDYKRRKEVVTRHFKKAVKIERLFSNKKRRNYIREEREYLNGESSNTLKEFMTTSGMYFAAKENPGIPAVMADVPDSTGVLGSGFTPPIGGDGTDTPSNYPAAYDTSWMYNSNDVDGETNRPIVRTIDQSVIDAYNTAFPDDTRFPAGGAGIVFGNRGFGTGVGYASGGHYIGVLSPGLFGNGSTKTVPGDAPFDAPWFGMGGLYFPATIELAGVIKSMSSTYSSLGGYNPSGALPIQLWAPWSRFHDGDWEDQGTQKYISNTGNRYVIRTFFMYQAKNEYVQTPAVPPTSTVLYRDDLGDPNFLPIKIDLGDISDQGFQYLEDKATASSGVNYDVYNKLMDDHGIEAANWYENNPTLPGSSNPHINPLIPLPLELVKNDSRFSEPVSDIEPSGLGAKPGDQLALAPSPKLSDEERLEDAARTAYIRSGGLFPWSYLDPQQKEYWRNKVGKGSDSLGSQPEVPDEPPVYVDTTEITSADIPDEFKLDDEEKPSAKGVKLTKWMSRTDFMKLYPDSSMGEYFDALPYGATDFMTPNPKFNNAWDLNTKGFEDYFMTGDLSALGNSRGIPKPRHSEATPDPNEKKYDGKTYEQIIADLDADIAKYTAAEKAAHREMRAIALELGADFVSLIGGLFTGGTTAAPVLGKIGIKVAKKYGKSVAAKMTRKLLKRFKNQKNQKQLDDLVDFIDDSAGFDLPTPKPKPKSEPKFTDPITGKPLEKVDPSTITRPDGKPFDPLPPPPKPTPKPTSGTNIPPKPKTELPKDMEYVFKNGEWISRFKESKPKPKPKDDFYVNLDFGYTPEGDTLSEEAMLGFFEPEQLNVNIEDLRKGIMPEFPKEAPPELINGYSSKSRLAPKKLERSSFIKITKKDLAKNHMLKDSEIKYFMKRINAVNDFIKKHPEELVYAQTRYPKSDPRLAQLNWEMDQKLNASKQYMDQHYPENQKLFTKIQKSIKKNIELTDPKSFKGVKTPKFKGVDLTDYKRRKAVVSRHFKKAIRNNKK